MRKLSDKRTGEFFIASRDRRTSMAFDATTALTPEERGRVLEILTQISTERPTPAEAPQPARAAARARNLPSLDGSRRWRPRGSVGASVESVPSAAGAEVFRQVLWSVEEGALRRFDARLAANIASKKIREGAWTRAEPDAAELASPAVPETCSAA